MSLNTINGHGIKKNLLTVVRKSQTQMPYNFSTVIRDEYLLAMYNELEYLLLCNGVKFKIYDESCLA